MSWVHCPAYKDENDHTTHWHTVRAGGITYAQGQCPGWPDSTAAPKQSRAAAPDALRVALEALAVEWEAEVPHRRAANGRLTLGRCANDLRALLEDGAQ